MEEKGGVLHILFIFLGIALLGLGIFYLFTDEKIKLDEDEYTNTSTNTEDNKPKEEKVILSQISLMNNVETTITLKNGKEAKIQYYINEETNEGKFLYNGKTAFDTEETEACGRFIISNNSIISFCTYGTNSLGHLYIVNSDGTSTKVTNFKDKEIDMMPADMFIKDSKLIITGKRVNEDNKITVDDKEIDVCNQEELKSNNIETNSLITANYELKTDTEVMFEQVEIIDDVFGFTSTNCKTVE